MIRYCLVDHKARNEEFPAVHFFQWAKVFQVNIVSVDEALNTLHDGKYDIIHIRLCRENMDGIEKLRHSLGAGSQTKLIASLDISRSKWADEFDGEINLKKISAFADILTATEYWLSNQLELISGKKTFELAHPADIHQLKEITNTNSGILPNQTPSKTRKNWRILNHLKAVVAAAKFLFRRKFFKSSVTTFNANLEANWLNYISHNKVIAATPEGPELGELYIYAAAMKRLVIGYQTAESVRRCYPFTSLKQGDYQGIRNYHYWLEAEEGPRNFYIENALRRVEYYNWGNSLHRLYNIFNHVTSLSSFELPSFKSKDIVVFHDRIIKRSGPRYVPCSAEEFVLVCLLKNGSEYIHSFMNHYRKLNCKHFYFIDNGSSDDTLEKLSAYDNVTIYHTDLKHKDYENEIRRTIINEQIGCWCLCVDIDELFDYPFSKKIPVRKLLQYLNKNRYTAVAAYMLDMFSKEIDFEQYENADEDLELHYNYYDISGVQKRPYFSENTSAYLYNKLANNRIQKYYGGIRGNKFSTKESEYLLLKHPLVYIDGIVEPITTPHYCDKALVADFTALIKHYKFTPKFKKKVIESVHGDVYTYYAQKEYTAYHKVLKNTATLSLYNADTSKEFNDINQLIDEEFLIVSENYSSYCKKADRVNAGAIQVF